MKKLLIALLLIMFVSCDKQEPITNVAAKGNGKHDIIPPTLNVISPTNGTVLPLNTPFRVIAEATDNIRVVQVGFIANFPNPYGPEIIPSQQAMLNYAPWQTTFVTPNQPCNIVLIIFASDAYNMVQKNVYLSCK